MRKKLKVQAGYLLTLRDVNTVVFWLIDWEREQWCERDTVERVYSLIYVRILLVFFVVHGKHLPQNLQGSGTNQLID